MQSFLPGAPPPTPPQDILSTAGLASQKWADCAKSLRSYADKAVTGGWAGGLGRWFIHTVTLYLV